MKKTDTKDGMTASQHIDNQIKELADWRGKMLARLRKLILGLPPISPRNGSGIPRSGLTGGLFVLSALSSKP